MVEWRKIRGSLAAIDVDADTATVLDGKAQCLVRNKLERLAQQYRVYARLWKRFLTARRFVNEVAKQRNKVAAVRDLFAYGASWVTWAIGEPRAAEIYQLLTTVEAGMQEKVTMELQKKAKGLHDSDFDITGLRYGGRQNNAGKPALREYVFRLANVWDELAGKAGEPRHRNRFVLNCAAPVANVTIKNVRDFLSNKKTKTPI